MPTRRPLSSPAQGGFFAAPNRGCSIASAPLEQNMTPAFAGAASPSRNAAASPAALFIAHPDDETMFFLPTLLHLSESCNLLVVCVTHSDSSGSFTVRQKELQKVCRFLRIPPQNLLFIDGSEDFPDSQSISWNVSRLSEELAKIVTRHGLAAVYTFDEVGISGHCNHRDLFLATRMALQKSCASFRAYKLVSCGTLWKYCLLSKFFCSVKESACTFSLSFAEGIFYGLYLMKCHASQLLWFRYLYIIFSKYTSINEYIEIN